MRLTKKQARALKTAVTALNDIGACFTDRIELGEKVSFFRHYRADSYEVNINGNCVETFDTFDDFCAEYKI